MDPQDRRAIEQLFDRLAEVEQTAAPRDPEAEALIRDLVQRRPQAAYYMAQTVIMQQKALEEAERRLGASDADEGPRTSGRRGFTVPAMPRAAAAPEPRMAQGGGGFLAGAAQTAVGVAGGVMLGSMLGNMLGIGHSTPAEAAGNPTPDPAPDPQPAAEPQDAQTADGAADGGGGGGFWDSLFGGGGDSGGDAGGGFDSGGDA